VSEKLQPILEALVFAADHPLSPREISDWLPDYSIRDIRAALNELEMEYGSMGRSFFLKEVARGYQFRTKREFAPYVLKMYKTSPSRLSQAALETLAIIAYKQPILRQEIEKLRGVDVGGIVRTLLEKGLIRIVGRKNLPGRPFIYGTTKKFLEVFDLTDLNSLPKLKEIKTLFSNGEGAIPALQAPEGTSDAIQEEAAGDAAPEGPKD
jgi:segregation and condensation protein B